MGKVKVWKKTMSGEPSFPDNYKVTQRWEGNCMDMIKNSNKFYHAEIQVAPNGEARIFTMYGRVGAKNPACEHRYYPSEIACQSDYNALIVKKSGRKNNPYREVDLAITSIGSDGAKDIKKPMAGVKISAKVTICSLHSEVQRLVSGWFGSTGQFITMTLKCPLGQLTKEQIDKGRDVLDECKKRVNSGSRTSNNIYDTFTNQFYSLIPHVLPHKINPDDLRLNTIDRVMAKHDTLDTFLDAKNVASVLGKGKSVEEQYKKLEADLDWIDPQDPINRWIVELVHNTRSRNHGFLGKIKVFNVFSLKRNGATDHFSKTLEKVARQVDGRGRKPMFSKLSRPDTSREESDLFKKANVWPLWHGTRPQNMVGIISRGLLIRPSGAVYTGSMFGSGIYFAESSSKSANYCGCKGAYWSGPQEYNRVYMFLSDVIVGNPHLVYNAQYFNAAPKGTHSVYALPGKGLVNSENIVYSQTGKTQQHMLKYIVEFQSQP
jgi:poly [ADP-ribose] polymerase